jgi:hypothetical protein
MAPKFITDSYIYQSLKHHWLTVAFLLGFVTDFILLNRVDDKVDDIILMTYATLASLSLILFYVGVAEKVPPRIGNFLVGKMPLLMQYAFGGLLSGMLIFYGRSGDLLVSAPFLILILSVIVANELVKKRSDRLLYNLIVYFIGIYSYLVLMIPVWIGDMGDVIFIGSGFLALVVVFVLVQILSKIIPNYIALEKRLIVFSIGSIYAIFNGFYFFNIIPPIPLSLTELSIYQQVERTSSGGYRLVKEEEDWLHKIPFMPTEFSPIKGLGAYCFARVYAPTNLRTKIVHRWEYEDAQGNWQTMFTQSYQVTWENRNGYRGYTTSNNLREGKMRCGVETERGQVLGRVTFVVDSSREPKQLVTVVE